MATDVLVDGADAIVMVGDRLTLVSGIAVELLNFLSEWRSFDEVVSAIVDTFGQPDGNADVLVDNALIELHDAGLIIVETKSVRPLRLDAYFPQVASQL
ncbi:hypothetical protein QCD70_15285 [Agreia sp. PsM10]|uniref:hypothetical protein n=1 Tax=Agreia sp. PsM10 TaxID=3030533 RepID=UPI00263AE90E|nr:hypothetical protein [Agreia sp. PsM10]MDN4641615.1 hypothetical protein [Agreia sp. PsM10]